MNDVGRAVRLPSTSFHSPREENSISVPSARRTSRSSLRSHDLPSPGHSASGEVLREEELGGLRQLLGLDDTVATCTQTEGREYEESERQGQKSLHNLNYLVGGE